MLGVLNFFPFDVMVVWFKGNHGISNKIHFPQPEQIKDGILMKSSFNEKLNDKRYNYTKVKESKIIKKLIGSKEYDIEVENGIVNISTIPVIISGDELWERFTEDEQDLLVMSNNPKVKRFLYELTRSAPFDLNSSKINTLFDHIKTEKILNTKRTKEIKEV